MSRLPAPLAETRAAVRRALHDLPDAAPVLVACSGGPDSLALAAATAFVAPRAGRPAGLVTVDHRLQPGSGAVAAEVVRWAAAAGFDPAEVAPVTVPAGRTGPEAAARTARYRALAAVARRHRAGAVLLGHTEDDQAETVLLALARGSGPRGLAGMPPVRRDPGGLVWLRPLLAVSRATTRAACAALGLTPWDDPHNTDPSYARSRVRATALPALVDALGDRVVANLARTAGQLAADTAVLDRLAGEALAAARTPDGGVAVAPLAALPEAVRTRVLHAWARECGASSGALSHRHVAALDALVTRWHGQGPVDLPGAVRVARGGSPAVLSAGLPDPVRSGVMSR